MTATSARQVTVCASAKGGQGCTTIAAVLAVLAAQSNQPTLLLDTRGDAAPILGVSDPAPAGTFAEAMANAVEPCRHLRVATIAGDQIDSDATSGLERVTAAGHRVIVDTGTDHDVLHRFDPLRPQRLLVTRPCYLALRRAIGVPFVPRSRRVDLRASTLLDRTRREPRPRLASHQRALRPGDRPSDRRRTARRPTPALPRRSDRPSPGLSNQPSRTCVDVHGFEAAGTAGVT